MFIYRPLLMPIMKRSCPEIQGSSHDKHEETGDAMENCSQTHERHKQSMHQQSPPSQPSHPLSCLKKMFSRQGINQSPCSSDGRDRHFRRLRKMFSRQKASETFSKSNNGDFPYLTLRLSNSTLRLPWEGGDVSSPDRTVQHDPEMDQIQDHEPGSADQSGVDFNDAGRGSVNDNDFDHPISVENTDVGNSSKWCTICRDVEKFIRQGIWVRTCVIGTWEDLQERAGCPSCDDLMSMLSGSKEIRLDTDLYFLRNDSPKHFPYSYLLRDVHNPYVYLNHLDRVWDPDFMGSMVHPNWFDIARLRKWLTFCDENHGGECHSLPIQHQSVSTRPRYLIDVAQGCLIESRGDERYFALSYVWGTQQEAGMATKGNINLLMRKGTIKIQNTDFRLPRTVQDVILLTKLLGERFLWVDRLCIIQDDLDNWHSQIKKMGSIYANAYCTLVASGGKDANHGIAGLSQRSGARQLLQRRIRFPSIQMIETQVVDPTETSTWNKRGWTFQEVELSRRALFFNNDVRWACHKSEWQEDIAAEPEGIAFTYVNYQGTRLNLLHVEPWPDFEQWWDLIRSYSQRQFRFENEAGAAFAGIEEILGHSFPGGFCFGIPEFFFDIALLWSPLRPMQRRDSSKSKGSSFLPSWSFIGWKGGHLDVFGPAFAYEWLTKVKLKYLCNTSSIAPKVDWLQIGPYGQERRISNDYHIWKRSQHQESQETHEELGWCKEKKVADWTIAKYNFWTHASIPNVNFRYPVPLGFHMVPDEYTTWPGSLRLRSQSTFLKTSGVIGRRRQGYKHHSNYCLFIEMVTYTGRWAGMLHLNINEIEEVPIGANCELVALSCGSVSNDDRNARLWLEEWSSDGRPRASEKYEFYNVMWIRREDTYVVRENVGRVEKSVWDSQELQEIDVELR